MIQSLQIQAIVSDGYTETIFIDSPLNKKAVSVNITNLAYYAYKKARATWKQLPCSHADNAKVFKVCDGWTGLHLFNIERYVSKDGRKMIRFI